MLEYADKPVMYKAALINMQLIIEPIMPQIYMRIGTEGLGATKLEAVEILKLSHMKDFLNRMEVINWQAHQYIPGI